MRFGKPTKNKRRHNPRYHILTEGANIENNSSKNLHDVQFYLEEFYPFCKKALGFEQDASIVFESDYKNAKDPLGKTAYYDPSAASISVYVDARHPKDIMRSVAHELVHHHQNVRGDLQGTSMEEGYAQNDEHLREMEREAYEKGNLLFRDWEDHKKGGGDESLMARIMEKWGYDAAALTEGSSDFEEGQLVTVVGSALTIDGEKKGTVISFEDPAVTIQLDDDQEGKHVPDDKMVKVKKDYVEARVESGLAPEMGASEEETLAEYDGDEFDMESLEREFPWLAKVKPDIEMGTVPLEVLADIAADEDIGEPELETEEAPLEEAGNEEQKKDFEEKLFAYLKTTSRGITAADLKFAFPGSPVATGGALLALANDDKLIYNPNDRSYTLPKEEVVMKEAGVGNIEVGDDIDVLGGGLTGASGKVIELTKTTEGADAVVIELTKDADKPVMGKAGDEVIAKYEDIELADLPGDKRPKPGEDQGLYAMHYTEAAEPDTSQMNNKEFFDYVQEKYGAVPIGGEDPSKFPNREAEGLEGPFKYGTGHILYYDQREGKYYNPETDLYIEDSEMEKIMTKPTKQGDTEMNLEEIVRQAVRKALKEKKYRREDEEEETNEGKAKSTEKHDDDSALKGDQDELPDKLQKGIIDAEVEEEEEEEKEKKNEGKLPPWLQKEGDEEDDLHGSRLIEVEWDTDAEGEGAPPPAVQRLHRDAVAEYNEILATEGQRAADDAITEFLTEDTGWLIIGWEWKSEAEETNEGKQPPWLKKEGEEEESEEEEEEEKNESLDTKEWWDNSLYERLIKKWTK